jgi:Mrp family chromosome partitioning ATPase
MAAVRPIDDAAGPPRRGDLETAADIAKLQAEVSQSERALATLRDAQQAPSDSANVQDDAARQALAASQNELAAKEARYHEALTAAARGLAGADAPVFSAEARLTALRARDADLARREADLSPVYGSAYPALVQLRREREANRQAILAEMKRSVAALRADADAARAKETALRDEAAAKPEGPAPRADDTRLAELEGVKRANEARLAEALRRAASQPSTNSAAATASSSPISSLVGLAVATLAGAALGFAAGLGAVWLRQFGPRNTFDAGPDFAIAAGRSFVLGQIPHARQLARSPDPLGSWRRGDNSPFAKGIEGLVRRLAATLPDAEIFALAALSPGEGASTLALCLTDLLGRRGHRVLLLDLGGGAVTRAGQAADDPGLSDMLDGGWSANGLVRKRGAFDVLPAGRRPLGRDRDQAALRAFLQEARRRYDLILLDCPPFVTDPKARPATDLADAFALVVSWDHLMRDSFVAATDAAYARPNFAGLILNRTAGAEEQVLARAS